MMHVMFFLIIQLLDPEEYMKMIKLIDNSGLQTILFCTKFFCLRRFSYSNIIVCVFI